MQKLQPGVLVLTTRGLLMSRYFYQIARKELELMLRCFEDMLGKV